MVGATLRRMSDAHGTSSLTSIHQPRASLLAVFDSLLLLAEGRCVYFGPTGLSADAAAAGGAPSMAMPWDGLVRMVTSAGTQAALSGVDPSKGVLAYFAAAGHRCPPLENPADWLLDLVHRADASGAKAAADVESGEGAAAQMEVAARVARARAFADAYAASPLAARVLAPPPPPLPLPLPPVGKGTTLFPTSWLTQFAVLWRRTMLYKLREPAAVMTQATTAIIMPLIVGGIYWHIPLTQSAITDRLAAISFLVLMQSFMAMDQILLFPKERAVYLRDHATGLHSTSSFFLARTLAEMPFVLLFGATSATISYFMFGFTKTARKYLIFLAIIVAVTEAGAALLASVGAMSSTMETGNVVATLLVVILALLDGFYRNLNDLPLWCRWASKFSFLGYGVQAAAVNEFRGTVFSCTAEEATTGCIPTGDAYLQRLGMAHTSIGLNVLYILIIAAGSRCITYLSLRFLYTGQTFRERLAQP